MEGKWRKGKGEGEGGGKEREDGSENDGKRGRGAEGKVAGLGRERSWSCVAVSVTELSYPSAKMWDLYTVLYTILVVYAVNYILYCIFQTPYSLTCSTL